MLFTKAMSKKYIYIITGLLISLLSVGLLSTKENQPTSFNELVRLSLRDVGNQLLLANQDSTSLVLPVKEIEPFKYQLSFQETLTIEPDSLLAAIKHSFLRTNLPTHYRVEVLQCAQEEVAYSYEIKNTEKNSIVPCRGRNLPNSCYTIEVRFTKKAVAKVSGYTFWYYGLLGGGLLLFLIGLFQKANKKDLSIKKGFISDSVTKLGNFHFFPEQNKLIKEAQEISLSKKECELLVIFMERPNEIIKREELSKRVWEDKGVVVGRSLDTYISKLRKKLQTDNTIKLTNIHGVGYKLELD